MDLSKIIHLLVLWILFCGMCLGTTASKPILRAVSMLFRHGDRAPQYSYPTDPYKDFDWPGGYGALSPKGAYQLYHSGQLKAKRYSALLSSSFKLDKIFVRTSASERCVESVYSFLEAFLPVSWPLDLVNKVALDQDEFLGIGKMCSNYMWQYSSCFDYTLPAYSAVIDFNGKEGKDLVEYFENHSGNDFSSFYSVHDTIKVQLDNGLPMPKWAETIYDKYLVPLSEVGMDVWSSTDLMHIRNGVFIREIIDRFDNFLNNSSATNIIVYSGHDLNIAGLMHHLEIKEQVPGSPEYGAAVSFEIFENPQILDDFQIKMFYFWDYGDESPVEINIPFCNTPCTYKTFKNNLISKYVWDHDEACSK